MDQWLIKYRIFPRLILLVMLVTTMQTFRWMLSLEAPSVEQAGFATGFTASAVAFFKFYMENRSAPPNQPE